VRVKALRGLVIAVPRWREKIFPILKQIPGIGISLTNRVQETSGLPREKANLRGNFSVKKKFLDVLRSGIQRSARGYRGARSDNDDSGAEQTGHGHGREHTGGHPVAGVLAASGAE